MRIVDIHVNGKYGIFDDLNGYDSGQKQADLLRESAKRYYGTPIIEYLNNLTGNIGIIEGIKIISEEFRDQDKLNGVTGQIKSDMRGIAITTITYIRQGTIH